MIMIFNISPGLNFIGNSFIALLIFKSCNFAFLILISKNEAASLCFEI